MWAWSADRDNALLKFIDNKRLGESNIMADTKWLEIAVNTTPDKLDEVCAKLAAAGMDGLVIEDEGEFLQFLEQNRQY